MIRIYSNEKFTTTALAAKVREYGSAAKLQIEDSNQKSWTYNIALMARNNNVQQFGKTGDQDIITQQVEDGFVMLEKKSE
jgi:hypothetical protein